MRGSCWLRGFRRAGRRTNLALLVGLIASFVSGWFAFATFQPLTATLVTTAHGLFGLGVVALLPWKTVVVRRAPALRIASLLLVGLLLTCLIAGFVEVFAGYGIRGGLSPIQVHVGAALVGAVLITWHVLAHRRQHWRRIDLSRRRVLVGGVFGLGVGAAYAGLEGVGWLAGSRSAKRAATGSHRIAAHQGPPTIWLFDRQPSEPTQSVRVAGQSYLASSLDARGTEVSARLDCTSGWFADGAWRGVRLSELIKSEVRAGARSVIISSESGYRRSFSASEADKLWLATRYDGVLLEPGHGAPVRLVAPGHRGFWWVKWVTSVELSERPAWAQSPFPLR